MATNPLWDNLVACYDLDDETDSTSSGYTLTNNNSVTFSTGLIGNVGSFSKASSKYLSRTDNADLSVNSDYTVSVWVKLTSYDTTGQTLVAKRSGTGCEYAINHVDSGPTEKFVVQIATSAGSCSFFQTLDSSDLGNTPRSWAHVLWRWSSSSLATSLWVNGVQEDSDTATGSIADGATAFTIGALATPTFYLDGEIDSTMVFKRAVTDVEISTLYNAGSGLACP